MVFNNYYYDEQSVQYIAVAAVAYSVALVALLGRFFPLLIFGDIWMGRVW